MPVAGSNLDPYGGASQGGYPNADINGLGGGGQPLSGFAARYNPAALTNIYSTPWSVLPDVFPGMNMAGAGYQSLRDIGGDPLTLYNIMAGNSNDLASGGVGGYANWLASLYKNLGTVGGRQFSAKEMLNNLFNPGRTTAEGGNQSTDSALQNILTSGDAATQMRTLFNMVRDATNVGMNPLAARGYQSAVARAGDQAINQQMTSNAGAGANNAPIYEIIRQIAPGLLPR